MQDISQLYQQISTTQAQLVSRIESANPLSPTALSEVCVRLAVLNSLLGSWVTRLKKIQLEKEAELYSKAKQEGSSDTGAIQAARLGSVTERLKYESADTRHKDLWKLISMSQTHIKAETEERRSA